MCAGCDTLVHWVISCSCLVVVLSQFLLFANHLLLPSFICAKGTDTKCICYEMIVLLLLVECHAVLSLCHVTCRSDALPPRCTIHLKVTDSGVIPVTNGNSYFGCVVRYTWHQLSASFFHLLSFAHCHANMQFLWLLLTFCYDRILLQLVQHDICEAWLNSSHCIHVHNMHVLCTCVCASTANKSLAAW